MGNVYKAQFSKEQLNELKASEARNLKEKENTLTGIVAFGLVTSFLLFALLIAMFLWFNKVTIFLTIIVAFPFVLTYAFYIMIQKEYKSLINDYKQRIDSQQKHVL